MSVVRKQEGPDAAIRFQCENRRIVYQFGIIRRQLRLHSFRLRMPLTISFTLVF